MSDSRTVADNIAINDEVVQEVCVGSIGDGPGEFLLALDPEEYEYVDTMGATTHGSEHLLVPEERVVMIEGPHDRIFQNGRFYE